MFKNYFKTAFRSFRKNKFYTLLNISGLATGLATCLMIMLYVHDELSYDRYNVNADRIYRINTDIKFGSSSFAVAQTPALLGPEAVKQIPGVEQYARLRSNGSFLVRKGNVNLKENRVVFADSTMFDVFSLKMISGDPATALKNPFSVVINETTAKKYFNRTDVAGQFLTVNDTVTYKITGVIQDVPQNSHFNFDFFLPFVQNARSRSDDWLSQNFNTYILLKKDADAVKIEKQVGAMLDRFIEPELKTVLNISKDEFVSQGNYVKTTITALPEIHLYSNRMGEIGVNGNIQYVRIFSIVALFILIIAYVNFMNLFIARSTNRAKEVGVRKVLGSLRKSLVQQFLGESLLISYLALIFAVLITLLMLPYFNQLSGKTISLSLIFQPSVVLGFLFATTVTALLAGIYPALSLSAFQPVEVLKGKITKGFRGNWLRNTLVVFQFSISIILIIGTIVIYSQLSYMRSKDIGFDRQQVLVIRNTNALKTNVTAFKNDLLQLSAVKNVTVTEYLPVNGYRNNELYFTSTALNTESSIPMQSWFVDENYIPVLNIKLLEGRNFSSQFPTDSSGLIINEVAAKLLDTKDPLNQKLYNLDNIKTKKIVEFHIIGVIKNFHFNSLREAVTPLCLNLGKERSSMALRLNTADVAPVIAQIKNKWQAIAAGQPFEYSFMDEDFNSQYSADQRTGKIIATFSVLAILIACLGLIALATYAAEQRIKEIGVRKVLGATVTNIVGMLSADFLKLVLVATLISFPVAWWAADKWLQGFAFRINITWGIFALAGMTALFIAMITISFQAIKAAMANPVNSLRSE